MPLEKFKKCLIDNKILKLKKFWNENRLKYFEETQIKEIDKTKEKEEELLSKEDNLLMQKNKIKRQKFDLKDKNIQNFKNIFETIKRNEKPNLPFHLLKSKLEFYLRNMNKISNKKTIKEEEEKNLIKEKNNVFNTEITPKNMNNSKIKLNLKEIDSFHEYFKGNVFLTLRSHYKSNSIKEKKKIKFKNFHKKLTNEDISFSKNDILYSERNLTDENYINIFSEIQKKKKSEGNLNFYKVDLKQRSKSELLPLKYKSQEIILKNKKKFKKILLKALPKKKI